MVTGGDLVQDFGGHFCRPSKMWN